MHILEPEPTRQNLKKAISFKRKEMINLGMKYGLTDKRTIKCSQQLDNLLNLHKTRKRYDLTG
ncbi:aspartyl-phosphate phosphatase Spo0E family protein [Lentibacillus salinarum]|uniref:Aspartyl-phosphate phosphatase Spo0E family protein n=1 Tax=Lentibacillus salinarum TaxID=446820 RepID=A0ABW3ZUT2_9BACI